MGKDRVKAISAAFRRTLIAAEILSKSDVQEVVMLKSILFYYIELILPQFSLLIFFSFQTKDLRYHVNDLHQIWH